MEVHSSWIWKISTRIWTASLLLHNTKNNVIDVRFFVVVLLFNHFIFCYFENKILCGSYDKLSHLHSTTCQMGRRAGHECDKDFSTFIIPVSIISLIFLFLGEVINTIFYIFFLRYLKQKKSTCSKNVSVILTSLVCVTKWVQKPSPESKCLLSQTGVITACL